MEQLFTSLTQAVEGSALIALGASFIWGILSVILSPCHLSSIPLIVGYISNRKELTTRKAFGISFLFSIGILITIGILGLITAVMGRIMGDVGRYGNYAVAVIFTLVGLNLMGVIQLPFTGPGKIDIKQHGLATSLLLGLIFGVALGPCTFAYMAPILAVCFKAAGRNAIYGIALLLLYGLGHCSVLVAAGTSAEAVQKYLNWTEKTRGTTIVKGICGALVILGGIYLILSIQ